jgi:hypothetical protein
MLQSPGSDFISQYLNGVPRFMWLIELKPDEPEANRVFVGRDLSRRVYSNCQLRRDKSRPTFCGGLIIPRKMSAAKFSSVIMP